MASSSSSIEGRADDFQTERKRQIAQAHRLQVIGAVEGGLKGLAIGGAFVTGLHYIFPLVRRQTLAGKAFLTSWFGIYGMTIYADKYLLKYEALQMKHEEAWRNQARQELAAAGRIATETAMYAWRTKQLKREAQEAASQNATVDS